MSDLTQGNGVREELDFAASVLKDEANALTTLAHSLTADFSSIIACLISIKGRIAVTGMGKSGIVARKIAATLSSTGSPAYFVHPAEASHGDMGMLTPHDALLVLSNSGNTPELHNIVNYAIQSGLPVVGITANSQSMLGNHATHVLLLPRLPEADILDCAPTTSTTMQMALGDAIAITLMRRRGITKSDFHRWHPGGALGQRLLLVENLMHSGEVLPLVESDCPMADVLIEMSGKGFGVVGVMEGEKLAGIITDGDLRRHMGRELLDKTALQVMTANPVVITRGKLAAEALKIMREKRITALFVMESARIAGILHIHDLLRLDR